MACRVGGGDDGWHGVAAVDHRCLRVDRWHLAVTLTVVAAAAVVAPDWVAAVAHEVIGG